MINENKLCKIPFKERIITQPLYDREEECHFRLTRKAAKMILKVLEEKSK